VSLWNLRLRALLEEQFALVATVLVVLVAVGGFVTYTAYVEPGTTTEERVVSTWETTGSFDHSATVVEENPVFPVGSTLENRSVYFSRLAPELNGTYVFGYRTTGSGELTAEIGLALVTRSSAGEGAGSGGEVLWETRRPLGERETTLASGESARVPFTLNASEVQERRNRIAQQLGTSTGSIQTVVQATVDVSGTVNGERVQDTRSHTVPLTFERTTYEVGSVSEPTQRTEITQPVTVERSYGPLRSVGGPALVLLSVVGLAGLVVVRRQRQLGLTDAERQWLRYREDRSEFDEWITEFTVPPETFDRPRAEAASLGDLVDYAIDTDNAVVESPDGIEYLVVGEEFLYAYTAPPAPQPDDRGDEPETSEATPEGAESDSRGLDEAARAYLGGRGDSEAEWNGAADDEASGNADTGATEPAGSPAGSDADELEPMADRLDAAAFDLGLGSSDDEDGADSTDSTAEEEQDEPT
jgi:hypothetical protein